MFSRITQLLQKISLRIKKIQALLLVKQGISYFDLKNEWDILIILDACRYDIFKKLNYLPGNLTSKISLGSCTSDWAKANLTQNHKDVVYVSANPFLSKYYLEEWGRKDIFHHLEELWDTGWDDTYNTVLPDTVTRAGLKMLKKFPKKKLVLHYMQPHNPFVGKRWIQSDGWKISREILKQKKTSQNAKNAYDQLKANEISKKEVIAAYEENLLLALHEVENFIKKSKNKRIVITSDHGDCFGEYGVYAHPQKTLIKELITVPWLKIHC